ncbi:MAG: hypothetical protein ACJAU1_001064, partial [Psychromonas sp.]
MLNIMSTLFIAIPDTSVFIALILTLTAQKKPQIRFSTEV